EEARAEPRDPEDAGRIGDARDPEGAVGGLGDAVGLIEAAAGLLPQPDGAEARAVQARREDVGDAAERTAQEGLGDADQDDVAVGGDRDAFAVVVGRGPDDAGREVGAGGGAETGDEGVALPEGGLAHEAAGVAGEAGGRRWCPRPRSR